MYHLPEVKEKLNWTDLQYEGKTADLFLIRNNKFAVALTNYGARLVSIFVVNKNDEIIDVLIGPGNMQHLLDCSHAYYGATIGRFANRIAKGKFTLDDTAYQLGLDDAGNHLHGGKGLQQKMWDVVSVKEDEVVLSCYSPDNDDNFPGNLQIEVSFSIKNESTLSIQYKATTNAATVVNFTNHAFFNLNGGGSMLEHSLQIFASEITPSDATAIPTGEYMPLEGTVFDFTKPKNIGADIDAMHEQVVFAKGYDHNFVLKKVNNNDLIHAATVIGNEFNIAMDVNTTEPGMHLYTGNYMDGTNAAKYGATDCWRTAFSLETQHFPDSPNKPHFPTTTLLQGQTFNSITNYTFYNIP
jgi:aldose 1-epimerase